MIKVLIYKQRCKNIFSKLTQQSMHSLFFFSAISLIINAPSQNSSISETERVLSALYSQSILKAKELRIEKIHKSLFAISPSNDLLHWKTFDAKDSVLLVTLNEYFSDYKPNTHNILQGYTWVTVFPELHTFCSNYVSQQKNLDDSKLLTRLQQKLGLPFRATEHKLVELWVQPQDLFRPCPDSEVTDNECQLEYPEEASEEHRKWLAEKASSSFQPNEPIQYPFTQLGYTYDWSPEAETSIGLSEYVIKPGSRILVGNLYSPREYCSNLPFQYLQRDSAFKLWTNNTNF